MPSKKQSYSAPAKLRDKWERLLESEGLGALDVSREKGAKKLILGKADNDDEQAGISLAGCRMEYWYKWTHDAHALPEDHKWRELLIRTGESGLARTEGRKLGFSPRETTKAVDWFRGVWQKRTRK